MADEPYGVLTGRARDIRSERRGASPHVHVLVDAGGAPFRASINVRSNRLRPGSSDLLFLLDRDFRHPLAASLRALPHGFLTLPRERGGLAVDYLRAGLFDRRGMRRLPADRPGPDNDLADRLEALVAAAMADSGARLHVYGHRWGPEPGQPDDEFGFEPGNGIHDVHMNQGSRDRHARDNAAWNDGALLLDLPGEGRMAALFLAFQSQSWRTDDHGHPARGSNARTARVQRGEQERRT